MKKLILIIALIITATTTATAKDKIPKSKTAKEQTSPYKFYTSIIDDKGREIKNPTVEEYNRCFVKYLINNTWESNVYRWQFQHIAKNWDPKETTTASDNTGHILNNSEKLTKNNFCYFS